jgi:hypothetical protein
MRNALSNIRFLPLKDIGEGRSCQECWFLGDHGNVGGSKKEDGLSLWPLQWIMSGAADTGLVLGFKKHEKVDIADPIQCAMPETAESTIVTYTNGLRLKMWDLSEQFQASGWAPEVNVSKSKLGPIATSTRSLFYQRSKKLIGWSKNRMYCWLPGIPNCISLC